MIEVNTYLGDGAYATFDGYGIWLKANHHQTPTDKVYLEPMVLMALIKFAENQKVINKRDE